MSKGTRITKRWIDADGIMRACYNSFLTTGNKAYSEIIALVEAVPAADVVEVRHGRWIIDEWNTPNCSVCGCSGIDDYYATPYCPHCGAKMDEAEDAESEV